MRYSMRRTLRKRVESELPDRHEQWVGLAYVEARGLPGYPLPRTPSSRGSGPACRLVLDKIIPDHSFSCGEA